MSEGNKGCNDIAEDALETVVELSRCIQGVSIRCSNRLSSVNRAIKLVSDENLTTYLPCNTAIISSGDSIGSVTNCGATGEL